MSITRGAYHASALTTCFRIAIAQGDLEQAERDAHDALSVAVSVGAYLRSPTLSSASRR